MNNGLPQSLILDSYLTEIFPTSSKKKKFTCADYSFLYLFKGYKYGIRKVFIGMFSMTSKST